MHLSPPPERYTGERAQQFCAALAERLGSLPGATSAAVTSAVPMADQGAHTPYVVEGSVTDVRSDQTALHRVVSPAFFQTAGIPLVAGRSFASTDGPASTRVRTLEVFRLENGRWVLLGVHARSEAVRAQPFVELELTLGSLWVD